MITLMTPEQVAESRRLNWMLVEPGFLVETTRTGSSARFVLTKEKCSDLTIKVIPLTRENIFLMLEGKPPKEEVIVKDSLMNVHPTAITDAMCTEREGLSAYCRECGEPVYAWIDVRTRTYRVGADGFCRHLDCNHPSQREPF